VRRRAFLGVDILERRELLELGAQVIGIGTARGPGRLATEPIRP